MRRFTIRILMFVFIGAILNVAVAWACALVQAGVQSDWNPYHNPYAPESPGASLVLHLTSRFGYEKVEGVGRSGTLLDRHIDRVQNYRSVVWWPAEATHTLNPSFAVATGWPARAVSMWCSSAVQELPNDEGIRYIYDLHWGIAGSRRFVQREPETAPALPMRPIWWGFMCNTIFYASVAVAVCIIPERIRRSFRCKRGRCPACGYPIGESPTCSECGATIEG